MITLESSIADVSRSKLAEQSQAGGGWLTKEDMHDFQPRTVEPIQLTWGDQSIYTLPPTSGGLTVLQTLHTLQALDWPNSLEPGRREIAFVEAMRLAWHDRLTLLGDPHFRFVDNAKLLADKLRNKRLSRFGKAFSKVNHCQAPAMADPRVARSI